MIWSLSAPMVVSVLLIEPTSATIEFCAVCRPAPTAFASALICPVSACAAFTTWLCCAWFEGSFSSVENALPRAPTRSVRSPDCPGVPCTPSICCNAACVVCNPATTPFWANNDDCRAVSTSTPVGPAATPIG